MINESLKGFEVSGTLVVAENKEEAIQMYKDKFNIEPFSETKEIDLDETFSYFNITDINESDYSHIYDRKHPQEGVELVSLKRRYASKYKEDILGSKKEIVELYC